MTGAGGVHWPRYAMPHVPERIVCLSAESADWLWRIGAWDRVVGVTAFFEQPSDAPPRPRVSGFSTARLHEIVELAPDLVITFSDVQASLAADLIKAGLPVLATNQRSLAEIAATLRMLGRTVGCEAASDRLLVEFQARLEPALPRGPRPRVYFEEWNDPLITGIAWVSELLERAGGHDVFGHLRSMRAASQRTVTPELVRDADPEIIFASWCGKPVSIASLAAREGWDHVSAVARGAIHEIPSNDILQPGFRLIHGFEQLQRIVQCHATAPAG